MFVIQQQHPYIHTPVAGLIPATGVLWPCQLLRLKPGQTMTVFVDVGVVRSHDGVREHVDMTCPPYSRKRGQWLQDSGLPRISPSNSLSFLRDNEPCTFVADISWWPVRQRPAKLRGGGHPFVETSTPRATDLRQDDKSGKTDISFY